MSFLILLAQGAEKVADKAGGADQAAPPGWVQFMPIILMVVIGYLLLFRPMQKQEKERKAQVAGMRKNDEVVTSAGIIGTVAKVDEHEVVIKIDENANVRMRVLKSSIVRVVPPKDEEETKEDKKD